MPRFDFDRAGLEVMPAPERFQTFADALDSLTLANMTDRLGETFGDRIAFAMEQPLALPGACGTTISFADLAALVRRTTGVLQGLGIRPGERVALCTRNRMELAIAEWAVLRAGAVAVPIGARLPPEEIARIIADAGARLLIADRAVLEGPLAGRTLPVAERLVVDADDVAGARGLGALLREAGDGPPPVEVAEDTLAVIFYTSGTTGRAKGVMLTHGNLLFATRNGLRMSAMMGPPPPMLGLMVMPLANTSGHQALLFSIVRGTSMIILDRFDAATMLDLVEQHRVTMLSGTPTMFRLLWEAGAARRDLSSILSFGGGGDYFHQDLIDRFRALPRGADNPSLFVTGYGMTETAGQVTQALPAPEMDGDLGYVQQGLTYRVVGPDGAPVARGEVGELELKGPNVTPGYWNAPEATAAAFHDGWLRTGDLVREANEPNRLIFAGRAKDVVISGGNTIYPPEIEHVLLEHPKVARAIVLGLPDPRMGEIVVAAVEPKSGDQLDEQTVLTWLEGRVAPYQRPRAVYVMELPTTADLKVKRRLMSEILSRQARASGA
jgi:acyl-CoA synthetase (AMP-forming)/AMP-acid ligase II